MERGHYASEWQIPEGPEGFHKVSEVNALGHKYALLPNGPEKEEVLLSLLENFHTYLMKYLNMVVRGHIAKFKGTPNKDSVAFLKYFIAKETPISRKSLHESAKSLHLAFKQQDPTDVYDILVLCLLRAIRKYDPYYTNRLRRLIEVISETPTGKTVPISQIRERLGFDCTSPLRMLVRHGFLAPQKVHKRILGYVRLGTWPPPAHKFGVDRIGFTYFVQKWFRYHLKAHIAHNTRGIEAKEDVMQLEHRKAANPIDCYDQDVDDLLPHRDGNFRDASGLSWAVDLNLVSHAEDLSPMNLSWVEHTEDPLFRQLTRDERFILYMRFSRDASWDELARTLKMNERDVRRQFDQIMLYLRGKAHVKPNPVPLRNATLN